MCERGLCEIDDGGFLFCPECCAREDAQGLFLPVRADERDFHAFSIGLEACPSCGQAETRRESDDHVYCFRCERLVASSIPMTWVPVGATCRLDRSCRLFPRRTPWTLLPEGAVTSPAGGATPHA
ncbi:MAG: hypothetical protein KGI89_16850 [Euryarchaeota archaeon]|nr:hypothetical protein [Euryarchaeota archaeon]